jgi:hypothetical protein
VSSSHSIDLGGASVAGDLSISDASVERDLVVAQELRWFGELERRGRRTQPQLAGSQFPDTRIKGLTVGGASDLQRARYTGKLEIEQSDFGKKFSATGTRFAGACEFRRSSFAETIPLPGPSSLQSHAHRHQASPAPSVTPDRP